MGPNYNDRRNQPGSYQQNAGNRSRQQGETAWPTASEFKNEWIAQKLDSACIAYAEKLGQYLVENKFTTSQIRNVYGEIKRIQMKGFQQNKTPFLLLLPKMAYSAKRAKDKDRSEGASIFESVMKKAHMAVEPDKDDSMRRFQNFCDFAEAVLAYHKANGGRD